MTDLKIGFIGVGNQGAPIARRIVDAGYDLTLWARRPESLEPYADTSARIAATVAELGAACDVVAICVRTDSDVADVCAELLPVMHAGSVVLIHSTVHPELCRRIAADAALRSVTVLDAPVSGGPQRASEGQLGVMVGGNREAYERLKPLIATFSAHMDWLGEVGSGQICKLINNAQLTVNFATSLSFLNAGENLGLDRAALGRMMQASSGQSYALAHMVKATAQSMGFGRPLLEKDVGLVLDVLGAAGLGQSRAAEFSRTGIETYAALADEMAGKES
ncbi:MAG: NAD(P)-dependent oxidoreductase [Novosphingobium sp.]